LAVRIYKLQENDTENRLEKNFCRAKTQLHPANGTNDRYDISAADIFSRSGKVETRGEVPAVSTAKRTGRQ
jgi:hypothetical protein